MAEKQEHKPLYVVTADSLAGDIARQGLVHLPSLRELRRTYRVSYETMLKAVHLLRERNVLAFTQGRKMVVAQHGPQALRSTCSANQLFERIKSRIANGTYRTGQSLPKVAFFTLSEHLSNITVCEALKMLEAENIIHKQGKRWLVGPSSAVPQASAGSAVQSSLCPVVLVLVARYSSWASIYHDPLSPFTTEFCTELRRHAYDFILAQRDARGITSRYFPTGRSEILSLINSLGNRYCGTLVASHYNQTPDLEEWINWLSQFRKPVVWLDHDNSSPSLDRGRIHRDTYFRACIDDEALVPLALAPLHAAGHRHIVFPRCVKYARDFDHWMQRRMEVMERDAAKFSPPLHIEYLPQDEQQWAELDGRADNAMLRFVEEMAQTLGAARGRETVLRERLFQAFPSLAAILRMPKATAIVAPNEWLAIQYYHWFGEAGVSIPRDFSLVSFDKHLEFDHHRISTVDPRMGDLGYRTGHVFIGDIPVKADRRGNMVNEPQFVDRGTLGAPRSGKLRVQGTRIRSRKRTSPR